MKKTSVLGIIMLIILSLMLPLAGCESTGASKASDDKQLASQNPPGGLSANKVPMFVSIGFDDNEYVEGIEWFVDYASTQTNPAGSGKTGTYDGTPINVSFFCTGNYSVTAGEAWKMAQEAGHEIGNHSYSHPHGHIIGWDSDPVTYEIVMDKKEWAEEIEYCMDEFNTYGIDTSMVTGFRQPFLEYTDNSIGNLPKYNFTYDCSIEEGFQGDQNGTNFFWPYTLDEGSPGNAAVSEWIPDRMPIGDYPGLWELPVYVLILPSDEIAPDYGIEPGFRTRMNEKKTYLEESDWKITGFDYNLWYTDDGSNEMMTPTEFLGVLKYNLDLRIEGNRAPFMLGAHIDYYELQERRDVIEQFVEYALSKPEVRIVSYDKILKWIKNPVAL